MSSWTTTLERWFAAVAFAEEGERETALQIVGVAPGTASRNVGLMQTLSDTFAAAAFAEENVHAEALRIMGWDKKNPNFLDVLGLRGVKVYYGVARLGEDLFLDKVGLAGVRVRFGAVTL